MTFADFTAITPSVLPAFTSFLNVLSGLKSPDNTSQSLLAASALTEYGAFEVALQGEPETAATLIRIATELELAAQNVAKAA